MTWLDADKDLLRTMWARGSSSNDIAASLIRPVSRNAVMGMVNRLGLMGLGHANEARMRTIDRVSDVLGEQFSLGLPLHREALLALTAAHGGDRSVEALAKASGVSRVECGEFAARLSLVWPGSSGVPARWMGGLEGNLAFILDMAVVAGSLSATPTRGPRPRASAVSASRQPWSHAEASHAT